MCGLVGAASFKSSGINTSLEKVFNDLLLVDSLRGTHGTGMFSVDAKGKCRSVKIAGNPFSLFSEKRYSQFTDIHKQPYVKILAGHNRYATKGDYSTASSHPFWHGKITLMHNGTLSNTKGLPKTFPVDSEEVAFALNEMSVEKVINTIEGAYAFVFYDSKKKTLNFLRNYKRPLFIGVNDKDNEIVWASEKEMLEFVLNRNHKYGFTISSLETEQQLEFSVMETKINPQRTKIPIFYNYAPIKITTVSPSPVKEIPKKEEVKQFSVSRRVESLDLVPSRDEKNPFFIGEEIKIIPYDSSIADIKKESFVLVAKSPSFYTNVYFKAIIQGKQYLESLLEKSEILGRIHDVKRITHSFKDGTSQEAYIVWFKIKENDEKNQDSPIQNG